MDEEDPVLAYRPQIPGSNAEVQAIYTIPLTSPQIVSYFNIALQYILKYISNLEKESREEAEVGGSSLKVNQRTAKWRQFTAL